MREPVRGERIRRNFSLRQDQDGNWTILVRHHGGKIGSFQGSGHFSHAHGRSNTLVIERREGEWGSKSSSLARVLHRSAPLPGQKTRSNGCWQTNGNRGDLSGGFTIPYRGYWPRVDKSNPATLYRIPQRFHGRAIEMENNNVAS